MKITITQSHAGSTSSIAQISEIDVFGKAGSTSARTSSSPASESTRLSVTSSSDSESKVAKGPTGHNENKESSTITSPSSSNHAPVARNDIVVAKSNKPEVVAILGNDNDPDGDKLGIVSITSTTRNGAFVKLNDNGTVTILPRQILQVSINSLTPYLTEEENQIMRRCR